MRVSKIHPRQVPGGSLESFQHRTLLFSTGKGRDRDRIRSRLVSQFEFSYTTVYEVAKRGKLQYQPI